MPNEKKSPTSVDTSGELRQMIGPILVSVAAGLALGLATKLLATNIKKSDVTGDNSKMPTEDLTVLSKKDTVGSKKDASLSNDEVSAQKGGIKASETEAAANENESKALGTGATAAKTGAGAINTDTTGMKLN